MQNLELKGVRQNNIKNIDLDLPLGKTIVITGPSGSGKSSLAFETIYAEGQRRYMQSLSTYARQFLEKFKAPLVERISNIPPTIALEQLNPVRNSRATVGTSTELYDYLRLLYEKVGVEYCANCQIPMERLTHADIFDRIISKFAGQTLLVSFHTKLPTDKQAVTDLFNEYLRSGYSRVVIDGNVVLLESLLAQKVPKKEVAIVTDRLKISSKDKAEEIRTRVTESIRTAMNLGLGFAQVYTESDKKYKHAASFTIQSRCPKCEATALPKSAIAFSFNSPLGACQTCKGFGNTLEVDPDLVIPNQGLTIAQGAVDPFTKPSLTQWQKKLLQFCTANRIDADLPYKELPAAHKKLIFEGGKKFIGVKGVFKELGEEKYKLRIRVFVSRYVSPSLCPDCNGARLNKSALNIKVGELSIAELTNLTLSQLSEFFKELPLTKKEKDITKDIFHQITRRLSYVNTVGLGYLTLSRLSRSLSGGEYQRILLATQLSQGLTDTMYVLDEPSIGLHPKDTAQLLKVLKDLRDLGNSLVIVEHDPEVIEWGEHVIDMGPGSGNRGGEVIFSGSRERFLLSDGETAAAIRQWKKQCSDEMNRPRSVNLDKAIHLRGAAGNNLKKVDVKIPLESLVSITGVSGSGKSTLVVETLYHALMKIFTGKSEKISKFASISGFEFLGAVELVDQTPIGKSNRSNPITFIKAYDEIRSLFAQTPEASRRGLTPGHFSFNVAGGRCEKCEGEGRVKIDMVFLEDIWVPCDACDEKRFKPNVLAVKFKGKNIDEILRMTVDEAVDFFQAFSALKSKLSLLQQVGLGYLQLGQPSYTLSGGESQRIKVARELAQGTVQKTSTLFILDEPTTGLHFSEITKLISVLRRLVKSGHSVVVIEHNLQLICSSDYVIDLGPDGGEHGGTVVAVGTPKELAQKALPHTGRYLSEILK